LDDASAVHHSEFFKTVHLETAYFQGYMIFLRPSQLSQFMWKT